MGDADIRRAVAGAVEYLTAHPGEARYRDGSARAVLRGGLVVDVQGPAGESVTTDMTTSIGGTGSAPSPGWLFRAAAASCVATLIALRAAVLDVGLVSVEVIVDSESDDRGILGMDDAISAGPLSMRVVTRVQAADANADEIRVLAEWAIDHCPVTDAIRRSIELEVRVEA